MPDEKEGETKNTGDSQKDVREADNKRAKTPEPPSGATSSYHLVVIMLVVLGVLAFFVMFLPIVLPKPNDPKDLLEYYKWTLSVLLGAFGAWIGAGAAYFFGKENLLESSSSTERAMEIQQRSFRRAPIIERVKDMTLTGMNPNFFFDFSSKKDDVAKKLTQFKGYWFVPVGDKDTGILQDIIHAQVFWVSTFKPDSTLKEIVTEMDKDDKLKKLHGDAFYAKVSSNDKISDVYNLMLQKDAEVAIVVDQAGKPLQCVSKTDLRNVLTVAQSG
jgi:hypothetical protein